MQTTQSGNKEIHILRDVLLLLFLSWIWFQSGKLTTEEFEQSIQQGKKQTKPTTRACILVLENVMQLSCPFFYFFNLLGGNLTCLVPQGIFSRSAPMPKRSNWLRVNWIALNLSGRLRTLTA